MMGFPKPTAGQLRAAFNDHKVSFSVHPKERARDQWANGLRAATIHHTAGRNSVNLLATMYSLPGANCVIQNGRYNGRDNDGKAIILAWGSAWHSGAGGPWKGVAGKDSLHLVSWGVEIESLGTTDDISDKQIENVGRMLAALVDLGMPRDNIHRHEDWTDGSDPVGGYPLPTNGRKIDTNRKWYPTDLWVAQAREYAQPQGAWDGVVPDISAVYKAEDEQIANPASWRLAVRLRDLGFFNGDVAPRGEQGYPVRAVANWQKSIGAKPTGKYGPKAHERIFDIKE
jgi:hypothetical protein